MSTGKINSSGKRMALLMQMNEFVFHAGDLANIWQINDKNTLYTTLKRYTNQGLLFRIHKGLYSTRPIDEIDPYILGIKAIHEYSYVTTETVLAHVGIINQKLNYITIVSSKSKRFRVSTHDFYSRQLNEIYLYQMDGIVINADGIKVATIERAVADLLYFNPKMHFDSHQLIQWDRVESFQKKIGYKRLGETS